jgi:hypothetical protein
VTAFYRTASRPNLRPSVDKNSWILKSAEAFARQFFFYRFQDLRVILSISN